MSRVAGLVAGFGLGGLGLLSLIYDDYALAWQPVPAWVPFHGALAYLSGAILLVCGLGMFLRRTAGWATLILAVFILSWFVFLQIPRVVMDPKNAGDWCGVGETLLLTAGLWTLFFSRAAANARRDNLPLPDGRFLRTCLYAFGAALPPIGVLHFMYPEGTASMVPAWMPVRLFWAYFTGSAHIAAGFAILLGILPALAAALEAVMITLFVLMLHLPGVAAQPLDRLQWTMFFVATAYAGAAWGVASSLHGPAAAPAAAGEDTGRDHGRDVAA